MCVQFREALCSLRHHLETLLWVSDSSWGTLTDEADEDVTERLRQSHGKLSGVDSFYCGIHGHPCLSGMGVERA